MASSMIGMPKDPMPKSLIARDAMYICDIVRNFLLKINASKMKVLATTDMQARHISAMKYGVSPNFTTISLSLDVRFPEEKFMKSTILVG